MNKQLIVLTDELLDVLGEEFIQKKEQEGTRFTMNFTQWVEFRLWELAHQHHAF